MPNPNGKERDAFVEGRRQAIIDAASEIASEQGVENLTLRKVAKKLNATTGLVMHYFSGREELVIAALNNSVDRVRDHLGTADDSRAPDTRIRNVFASSLMQPTEETANWPFRMAYMARAAHSSVLRDHYRVRAAANRKFFADQIRELQGLGRVEQEVDADGIAVLIQALFNGLGIDTTLDDAVVTPARSQELVKLFLDGVMGRKAASL